MTMLAYIGLDYGASRILARGHEQLHQDEYGAFAAVCKQELATVGEKATLPLCVRVPPTKRPPKALLNYLRGAQVQVSAQTACYPPNQSPRGMEISVEEIRRLPGGALELKVDTADNTPEPEEHLIVPLRMGTYRLTRNAEGSWVILSYVSSIAQRQ